MIVPGYLIFLGKYWYLSAEDLSDHLIPKVNDDLRVGASPDMAEGPSLAHFWSQDQVTHESV